VVFVADEDGSIAATVSLDNGRFEARVALPPPRSSGSLCVAPTAEDAVCDVPLYVNFEADSAAIRSDSIAILSDINRLLSDLATEGTDEYNRDLSQRRASAVAEELVALGFPSGALTTVGLGESEPIVFPDDDESARAINRRVEIVCR
jgi:outer membrane protein OmpA-like peptidoglycan-associated protein